MEIQIYLAGTCTFGVAPGQSHYHKLNPKEKVIADTVPHRLESYHYVGKDRKINEMRAAGVKAFIDSGAFSALTLGATIDLEGYCDYIKKNDDLIRYENGIMLASVLDGIGDAQETYENQLRMEQLGVRPLPCFHAGEDERYLEYYIANYDYITLGGMVGASSRDLEIWLDRIFERYLIDGSGNPRVMTHGFGITSVPLMERYPWYSCDSSSWIQTTAFGGIVIPGYGNLNVSEESPSKHDAGKHYYTLTEIERDAVDRLLVSQGFDPVEVRRYDGRVAYNLWSYTQTEREINVKKRAGYKLPLRRELF